MIFKKFIIFWRIRQFDLQCSWTAPLQELRSRASSILMQRLVSSPRHGKWANHGPPLQLFYVWTYSLFLYGWPMATCIPKTRVNSIKHLLYRQILLVSKPVSTLVYVILGWEAVGCWRVIPFFLPGYSLRLSYFPLAWFGLGSIRSETTNIPIISLQYQVIIMYKLVDVLIWISADGKGMESVFSVYQIHYKVMQYIHVVLQYAL